MRLPILFVNFKAYKPASGKKAVSLSKHAEAIAKQAKKTIVVAVQATDIALVSKSCKIPVFAQHIDPVEFGKFTGWISAPAVKEAGAVGVILNHAEHKLEDSVLQKTIETAKKYSLKVLVCAENLERAKQIASLVQKPDFIAIEVPELISRSDVSISTVNPELIKSAVKEIKAVAPKIEIIAGAGIHSALDVSKAIELGASGVFVSNKIVNSQDPKKAILELVSGFK
ncbi:MAG: triosephosphate isomerase [Candidatus Diapherotrites archaeon]|nr:triosephosphate isomerase [Candidatus Diapherotrites archaeon]